MIKLFKRFKAWLWLTEPAGDFTNAFIEYLLSRQRILIEQNTKIMLADHRLGAMCHRLEGDSLKAAQDACTAMSSMMESNGHQIVQISMHVTALRLQLELKSMKNFEVDHVARQASLEKVFDTALASLQKDLADPA